MTRLQEFTAWSDKRFPQTGASCLQVAVLIAAFTGTSIAIWRILAADIAQLTELLKVVVWPAVVCIGLLTFRSPLGQFLSGLSQRVKKVSAFKIELKLTELTAKEVTSPASKEIKGGRAMYVSDSGTEIFAQLQDDTAADYVVIDLVEGNEWLSSRLFIVAALFEQMRGICCMVFTEGTGPNAGRFMGISSLQSVRWGLARKYPWFEVALAKALTNTVYGEPAQLDDSMQLIRTDKGAYYPYVANSMAQSFIRSLQASSEQHADGCLKSHESPLVWERSSWVTQPRLRELLGSS